MTLAIFIVVAAVLTLVAIAGIAGIHSFRISAGTNPASQIRPLDIEAFRNLSNPAQDAYLGRRLPAAEFRRVRRVRLLALAAYIRAAGKNAAVLVRLGQAAATSSDAETAKAARQMVNEALLVRRNAAFVLLKIWVTWAWPGGDFTAIPIFDDYNRLNHAAMLLGRLQNPAAPLRISVR
jgi:hypothetical protein